MTSEKDSALFSCLGAFAALPIIFAVSWVCEGYVAKQLWAWYIVPTFGLPLISIPQALGIAFLWSLFSPTVESKKDDSKSIGEAVGKSLVYAVIKPAMTLAAGWIVLHWM